MDNLVLDLFPEPADSHFVRKRPLEISVDFEVSFVEYCNKVVQLLAITIPPSHRLADEISDWFKAAEHPYIRILELTAVVSSLFEYSIIGGHQLPRFFLSTISGLYTTVWNTVISHTASFVDQAILLVEGIQHVDSEGEFMLSVHSENELYRGYVASIRDGGISVRNCLAEVWNTVPENIQVGSVLFEPELMKKCEAIAEHFATLLSSAGSDEESSFDAEQVLPTSIDGLPLEIYGVIHNLCFLLFFDRHADNLTLRISGHFDVVEVKRWFLERNEFFLRKARSLKPHSDSLQVSRDLMSLVTATSIVHDQPLNKNRKDLDMLVGLTQFALEYPTFAKKAPSENVVDLYKAIGVLSRNGTSLNFLAKITSQLAALSTSSISAEHHQEWSIFALYVRCLHSISSDIIAKRVEIELRVIDANYPLNKNNDDLHIQLRTAVVHIQAGIQLWFSSSRFVIDLLAQDTKYSRIGFPLAAAMLSEFLEHSDVDGIRRNKLVNLVSVLCLLSHEGLTGEISTFLVKEFSIQELERRRLRVDYTTIENDEPTPSSIIKPTGSVAYAEICECIVHIRSMIESQRSLILTSRQVLSENQNACWTSYLERIFVLLVEAQNNLKYVSPNENLDSFQLRQVAIAIVKIDNDLILPPRRVTAPFIWDLKVAVSSIAVNIRIRIRQHILTKNGGSSENLSKFENRLFVSLLPSVDYSELKVLLQVSGLLSKKVVPS